MSELDDLRQQIDQLDRQIIQTYEKRLNVVDKVAEYKKNNQTNVLQQNREDEVLNKAVENLSDKKFAKQAKQLMIDIMDISKDYQQSKINNYPTMEFDRMPFDKNAKVGFFGEIGSNTWGAAIDIFSEKNCTEYASFDKIFAAIKNDEIKYGIVPIENSSTGAIVDVYDLLKKYDFYIIAEKWKRITHNLYSTQNSCLDKIKYVYSHPQAISQCDEFFKNKNVQLIPYQNTASSAKLVANQKDNTFAAITNKQAGELYGLKLLKDNIQNNSENFTRFIVIAKELSDCLSDKISVVFDLINKPGTLYNVLRFFSKLDINLIKIESRPVKNNPCNYYFFVDIDGNMKNKNISIALDYVKQNSVYFKFLGEYKKGEIV